MASEKRILTLTLVVLLAVFLSYNTVLPCWVLGQCGKYKNKYEGFQEGASADVDFKMKTKADANQVKKSLDDIAKEEKCWKNNKIIETCGPYKEASEKLKLGADNKQHKELFKTACRDARTTYIQKNKS